MNAEFLKVRSELANLHNNFKLAMDWYKQEMDNLRAQLAAKDNEIAELKKKLDEKPS